MKTSPRGEFEEIYYKWYLRFYKLSYGILKDEEETKEVMQEVFSKFNQHMNQVNPRAYVTWLHKTTINQSISHLRKLTRKPQDLDSEAEINLIDHDSPGLERLELRDLLDKLPVIHRVVLQLRFYDNYQVGEIARLLEVPEGTVKSRLFYALKYLKEKINHVDK